MRQHIERLNREDMERRMREARLVDPERVRQATVQALLSRRPDTRLVINPAILRSIQQVTENLSRLAEREDRR